MSIQLLPSEILHNVLSFSRHKDLLSAMAVSYEWYEISLRILYQTVVPKSSKDLEILSRLYSTNNLKFGAVDFSQFRGNLQDDMTLPKSFFKSSKWIKFNNSFNDYLNEGIIIDIFSNAMLESIDFYGIFNNNLECGLISSTKLEISRKIINNLKGIGLNSCQLSNDIIEEFLKLLNKVEKLDISTSEINIKSLNFLESPYLSHLNLAHCEQLYITNDDDYDDENKIMLDEVLTKFQNLKWLSLESKNSMSNNLMNKILHLSNLKTSLIHLNIKGHYLNTESLYQLTKFKNLKSLTFGFNNNPSVISMKFLKNLLNNFNNLKFIDLSGFSSLSAFEYQGTDFLKSIPKSIEVIEINSSIADELRLERMITIDWYVGMCEGKRRSWLFRLNDITCSDLNFKLNLRSRSMDNSIYESNHNVIAPKTGSVHSFNPHSLRKNIEVKQEHNPQTRFHSSIISTPETGSVFKDTFTTSRSRFDRYENALNTKCFSTLKISNDSKFRYLKYGSKKLNVVDDDVEMGSYNYAAYRV